MPKHKLSSSVSVFSGYCPILIVPVVVCMLPTSSSGILWGKDEFTKAHLKNFSAEVAFCKSSGAFSALSDSFTIERKSHTHDIITIAATASDIKSSISENARLFIFYAFANSRLCAFVPNNRACRL